MTTYHRSKESDEILNENRRLQCLIEGTDMSEPRHNQYVQEVKKKIKENLDKLETVDNELYKLFQKTQDKPNKL
jgi:vacuolar-type H+-ATPase subunit I/STV1